jgi:hypothetical protein
MFEKLNRHHYDTNIFTYATYHLKQTNSKQKFVICWKNVHFIEY